MRALASVQLLAATLAFASIGHAQQTPAAESRPDAYQDALIEGGALTPDIWDDHAPLGSTEGLPRGLRLDGLWSTTRRNGISTTQFGAGIGAFLATPQFGTFTFDGLFTNGEDTSIATLWQRDMPFDGGWRAANGVGMLNSPAIDLVRFQPRIFLPTSPMLGAVTEWRSPQGMQFSAGYGEPGVYYGTYIPEFRRLGGELTNLGAQWAMDRNWSMGIQYSGANDVTSTFQSSGAAPFSSRSFLAAASRQDATSRFQLNLLESQNSISESHNGVWFDGYLQTGRLAQSFGLFNLEPGLVWGNQPVANDSRGGYYRLFYSSPRWLWDAGVDYLAPIDRDTGVATTYLNGSVRYQFLRDLSAGTGANVRLADTTAWQGFAYLEHVTSIMTGRTQLNQTEDGPRKETLLTFNQTWNMPAGTRLNTTVGVGRYRSNNVSASNQVTVAAYGGGDIARNLGLDLNVQWNRWYGDGDPSGATGSLSLTWSILPRLSLIATGYRSQATARLPLSVSPPLGPAVPLSSTRLDDSGAFLILRFETRAGSLGAPIGGPPGAGAGRVAGTVFLDRNESSRFEAGEEGAANVTVILDGRYSTRTDAQGRFEFPAVASGPHVLTVLSDNLPLPWALVNDGRTDIDVPVRGSVTVGIPAQRLH